MYFPILVSWELPVLAKLFFFGKCGKTRQRHLRCLSFCGRKLDWNWTALEMWGKQHRIFSEVNSRIRRVFHTHSYINILLAWFNTPNTILNWIELWCICFYSAGICWSKFQCYLLYCFSWYDRAILFYNYYLSDVSGTYLSNLLQKSSRMIFCAQTLIQIILWQFRGFFPTAIYTVHTVYCRRENVKSYCQFFQLSCSHKKNLKSRFHLIIFVVWHVLISLCSTPRTINYLS